MKKIIIINISIILGLLLILEAIFFCHKFYLTYRKISKTYNYGYTENIIKTTKNMFDLYSIHENYFEKNAFRKPISTANTNKGIILLGCSFTYGERLNENETLGFKIYESTKQNIYNLGLQGGSPREMLYFFRNPNFLNNYTHNNKNISFILYTYIDDHLRRLYTDIRPKVPKYKLTKDNNLIEAKQTIHSELFQILYLDNLHTRIPIEKQHSLFNQYMLKLNEEIKKRYSDKTKFIILIFEEKKEQNNWQFLKDNGIIILNVKDITKEDFSKDEYLNTDLYHPNAKVWEELVPKLIDKLEQKEIL